MKITIKSGDIEICVEYEIQSPQPKETWYGVNMMSFTDSIKNCITKASEEVLKMQSNMKPTPTEKGKDKKCIDFAEWILIEGFEKYSDNGKCWWGKFNDETDYSTEQLYVMWLNTTPTEKGGEDE